MTFGHRRLGDRGLAIANDLVDTYTVMLVDGCAIEKKAAELRVADTSHLHVGQAAARSAWSRASPRRSTCTSATTGAAW